MEYESATIKNEAAGEQRRERAILVGVELPNSKWPIDSSLAELERLADTAGVDTVATVTQRLNTPNSRTFIGSGKAEEVAEMAQSLSADVVIFDDALTPSQQKHLEDLMGKDIKVIDRTALILDIFALHATSKEGRLQVQLAQNQYLLPRLRGMWSHLASGHMGGGVGSTFGEGENQLEVDRRIVRDRITSIKRQLAHLEEVRDVQRESRYTSGVFKVSLAGYTNSGKSSLLNYLTDADVLADDMLFGTLDTTTRKYELPEGREITISDTVGFIQKLPTTLVEAFKSTLSEITEADLILHIVDASSPEFERQIDTVNEVLDQIGAQGQSRVLVFNKCDLLDEEHLDALKNRYSNDLFISALTGEGIDELIDRISRIAAAQDARMEVLIPYKRGDLVSVAHERCNIESESHEAEGTHMVLLAKPEYAALFKPYLCNKEELGLEEEEQY